MNNEKEVLEYIKKIDIELLKEFKRICVDNKLKYYLAFGTLLGAVRHKGFIPWDDDIDIWMPREDYDKFIELSRNIKSDFYEIHHYTFNDKYKFPWVKMCDKNSKITPSRFSSGMIYGISIDIFPLDFVEGDNYDECIKTVNEFNENYKKNYVKKYCVYNSYSLLKKPIKFLIKKIWYYFSKILFKKSSLILDALEEKLKKTNGKFVSYYYDLVSKTFAIDYNLFVGDTELYFEDEKYSVPKNYNDILTKIYGDYMKLPPVEKQVSHHDFSLKIDRRRK